MASEGYYPSSSSSSPYNVTSPFAYVDQAPQHQLEDELSATDVGPVHFQMPDFMYATTPALASGGGAEVLPVGMLNETNWLMNNGFPPVGKQKQIEVWPDTTAYDELVVASSQQQQQRGAFDFVEAEMPQLSVPSPTHPHPGAGLFSAYQLDQFMETECQPTAAAAVVVVDEQQQQHRSTMKAKATGSVIAIAERSGSAMATPRLLVPPPPPITTAAATAASSGIIQPVYYSATGFDILSILARVFNRPYPRVHLGPVDLTCSFVVVDVRRHDNPIVYCSPTFCKLTGYEEREILGRNCRFLQGPQGRMEQGGERADEETRAAVRYLNKCLVADKECQTTIVNYKKDGTAFRNLLTVIPISGGVSGKSGEGEGGEGEQDVVFHVGFQIDLTEQPKAILENMKKGSYLVDHYPPPSHHHHHHPHHHLHHLGAGTSVGMRQMGGQQGLVGRDKKNGQNFPPVLMSKELKRLLAIPAFLKAIPITTRTNVPVPLPSSSSSAVLATGTGTAMDANELLRTYAGNNPVHMILLELGPDFVHVVSLKGSFLYVAPSVRRVLGYEPEELVGASFADLAHPEDLVPLMRELKESSTSSNVGANGGAAAAAAAAAAVAGSSVAGTGGGVVPGTALTSALGEQAPAGLSTVGHLPRNVSLMFRAKAKNGVYVWVESRGRLHVEPGKGRKAIILTGRAREMGNVTWETVIRGSGGIAKSLVVQRYAQQTLEGGGVAMEAVGGGGDVEDVLVRQEFWGVVSTARVVMNVGAGVRDVLGFSPEEFTSKKFEKLLTEPSALLKSHFKELGRVGEGEYEAKCASVRVRMKFKEGFVPLYPTSAEGEAKAEDETSVEVVVNVFRMERDPAVRRVTQLPGGISPAHLIYQVRVASAEVHDMLRSTTPTTSASPSFSPVTTTTAGGESTPAPAQVDIKSNLFEALDGSRSSSWQYELQQLKFGNQKLKKEVLELTAAIRAKKQREQREAQRAREEAVAEQRQREVEERARRQRVLAMQYVGGGGVVVSPMGVSGSSVRGNGSVGGRRRLPVGWQPQQQQQQQQQFGGMQGSQMVLRHPQQMYGDQSGLSLDLSPYAGGQAALPMRSASGYHVQQPHPSSSRGPPAQPFAPPGGYHHQGMVNDYLGPSPYIQRVQDEIASMYHGAGPSSSSGQGMKRGWDGMPRPS
ncbi:hypothetical protein MD484_g308, partial [Candolleomyces efflorescens]